MSFGEITNIFTCNLLDSYSREMPKHMNKIPISPKANVYTRSQISFMWFKPWKSKEMEHLFLLIKLQTRNSFCPLPLNSVDLIEPGRNQMQLYKGFSWGSLQRQLA